ncbi:unnamed protein product, partial [Prorocentrum cordatum]
DPRGPGGAARAPRPWRPGGPATASAGHLDGLDGAPGGAQRPQPGRARPLDLRAAAAGGAEGRAQAREQPGGQHAPPHAAAGRLRPARGAAGGGARRLAAPESRVEGAGPVLQPPGAARPAGDLRRAGGQLGPRRAPVRPPALPSAGQGRARGPVRCAEEELHNAQARPRAGRPALPRHRQPRARPQRGPRAPRAARRGRRHARGAPEPAQGAARGARRRVFFVRSCSPAVFLGRCREDCLGAERGSGQSKGRRRDPEEASATHLLEKYGGPREQTRRNREANGMAYEVLTKGKAGGTRPGPDSDVEIIFTGWRVKDGELIDSSYLRGGKPEKFCLNDVMTGWTIGIKQMKEGEMRRLWIPSALGDNKGDTVYDVQLVKTSDGPPWGFFVFLLFVAAAAQVFLRENAGKIAELQDPLADPVFRASLAPE